MTQSNGSIIETALHVALLLDVLHRHKRTVVVAGGLDGARHHSSESFAKFGILRYQCLDQGRILLKRARGIRYVGGLVLYYQAADVSNTARAFQENAALIKALVAKYPEFREAF